jgi:hypothetical protein
VLELIGRLGRDAAHVDELFVRHAGDGRVELAFRKAAHWSAGGRT